MVNSSLPQSVLSNSFAERASEGRLARHKLICRTSNRRIGNRKCRHLDDISFHPPLSLSLSSSFPSLSRTSLSLSHSPLTSHTQALTSHRLNPSPLVVPPTHSPEGNCSSKDALLSYHLRHSRRHSRFFNICRHCPRPDSKCDSRPNSSRRFC